MASSSEGPRELYRLALLTVGAVFAAMVGVWLAATALRPAPGVPDISGTYLDEGREIADFELVDQDGNPVTQRDLEDVWSVLVFGYSRSDGPTAELPGVLTSAYERLRQVELTDRLSVSLITVDTEHDTPKVLEAYMAPYPDSFRGLTGDEAMVRELAESLGIRFAERPDEAGYAIQPEAAMLVVNPEGELQALLIPPHHPEVVAQDLHTLIQREPGAWLHHLL